MAGILSYLGWATFGVAVRAYQQGIRQMPYMLYPQGMLYSAGLWVGVGYFFNQWTERNDKLLEERLDKFQNDRARRAALVEE